MVKQYPYRLQRLTQTGPTTNPNGAYVGGSETWVDLCKCRDENSNGRPVTVDGIQYAYNFLVQCPKGTNKLNSGEVVRVIDAENNVRVKGQVVHSSKDQLHTRIWV